MEHHISPITADEVLDLAMGLVEAQEADLRDTWERIQTYKLHGGEVSPEILFEKLELPIIMRLYPPSEVNPKVKKLISILHKRAKEYGKTKLAKYHEMRRYGLSIDKSRDAIKPHFQKEFIDAQIALYGRPFTYKYDITIRDADLIYTMGMDKFIKHFYDRFYQPIDKVK